MYPDLIELLLIADALKVLSWTLLLLFVIAAVVEPVRIAVYKPTRLEVVRLLTNDVLYGVSIALVIAILYYIVIKVQHEFPFLQF